MFARAFSSPIQFSRTTTPNIKYYRHASPTVVVGRRDASPPGNDDADSIDEAVPPPKTMATTSTSAENVGRSRRILSSAIVSHHAAIKTRDIENAIKFYSLLGFRVESKFVAGPARAAWLLHESCFPDDGVDGDRNNNNNGHARSRIELLEVPSYMLDEPDGTRRRAIDLTKREELLGLNHVALDVTGSIPRPDDDGGGSVADGTACALYQLREWMDDLDDLSKEQFGRSLRVALEPMKRIIGRQVYEMAFLYDADGTLVELLNHSGTLEQEVEDGWQPWDGKGFVQ